jgi:hypothetical protein
MPIFASFSGGSLKVNNLLYAKGFGYLPDAVSYLVIAGGGSTGYDSDTYYFGGGGGGGYLTGTANVYSGLVFSISVGAGGGFYASGSNSFIRASNTQVANVESMGGGRGGMYHRYIGYVGPENGGSGGGNAGPLDGTGFVSGGLGTPGQGFNGGGTPLTPGGFRPGAGGGGAGSAGQNGVSGPSGYNGVGGNGLASPISGTPVTYSRGGNGGGGGASGPANSGYGANGGNFSLGGSGVVFFRVANNYVSSYTGTPILTSTGDGFTVFKFTGAGTVTIG